LTVEERRHKETAVERASWARLSFDAPVVAASLAGGLSA
jgi:hypothetical protein